MLVDNMSKHRPVTAHHVEVTGLRAPTERHGIQEDRTRSNIQNIMDGNNPVHDGDIHSHRQEERATTKAKVARTKRRAKARRRHAM